MSRSISASPLAEPDTGMLNERFRTAMRLHAAGVCIITMGKGEAVNGMAATSVTSLSMDPPSMLFCINKEASMASDLTQGLLFGVTLLGRQHEAIAARFSQKPTGLSRFSHDTWNIEEHNVPWLSDAPANLSCIVDKTVEFGTHKVIMGLVQSVHIGPTGTSLVYRDGAYL